MHSLSVLSYMETSMGLTVVSPHGETVRVPSTHPGLSTCRELVTQLPAEQAWLELQELLAHPLKAISSWCASWGCSLEDRAGTLVLNGFPLAQKPWLALLHKLQGVSSSPQYVHLVHQWIREQLSLPVEDTLNFKVNNMCFMLDMSKGITTVKLVQKAMLPTSISIGDVVDDKVAGSRPCLVAFDEITRAGDVLEGHKGTVLQHITDIIEAEDILAQPFILGNNQTYICEEGSSKGWLTDLSFDSLRKARDNAASILKAGSDARIVNRLTKRPVSVI